MLEAEVDTLDISSVDTDGTKHNIYVFGFLFKWRCLSIG